MHSLVSSQLTPKPYNVRRLNYLCNQLFDAQAVVLEGKYWKRRLATVTAEYKKWRIFFKNQMIERSSKDIGGLVMRRTDVQFSQYSRSFLLKL